MWGFNESLWVYVQALKLMNSNIKKLTCIKMSDSLLLTLVKSVIYVHIYIYIYFQVAGGGGGVEIRLVE